MKEIKSKIDKILDKKVTRKKFLQALGLSAAAIPLLSPSVAAKFFLRQTNGTLIDIDDLSPGSATWGSITGTLSNQTDLQNALNLKANDADVVKLAGSQTITGEKTFSSTVTGGKFVPTANTVTGNGMYLPATNEVAISTNGSERLRITSTGIGIGTTTPGNLLHISGGNSAGINIDATNFPVIRYRVENIEQAAIFFSNTPKSFIFQNTATGPLIFKHSSSQEAMRITDTGNVGIGTTNPAEKLQVQGNLNASKLLASSTPALVYSAGIGNTPGQIYLNPVRGNRTLLIKTEQVSQGDAIDGVSLDAFYTNTTTPIDMLFRTGNSNRLIIKAGGNVGNGGNGLSSSITGSAVTRAGGGGGGYGNSIDGTPKTAGSGGSGGGGNGSSGNAVYPQNGTANTGGGGGGGHADELNLWSVNGANGGSGIVIIRYPF